MLNFVVTKVAELALNSVAPSAPTILLLETPVTTPSALETGELTLSPTTSLTLEAICSF